MASTTFRSGTEAERERMSAGARHRAEIEAEEALIKGKAVVEDMREAGQHIAEDAANMTRRTAETFQQSFQSGLHMAAQMAERSFDQLAGAAGLQTKGASEATQQSSRNLQAIVDSEVVLVDAVQKLHQEWLNGARDRLEYRLDAYDALLRCRNPADAMAIQIDLARRQMESFIKGSQCASELVGKAAGAALRKVKVDENSRVA